MDLMLKDKAALVTGGSRGIGLAIAQRLADEQAQVSICGRGQGDLDTALADLRGRGGRVHGVQAEVMLQICTLPAYVPCC